MDSLELAARNRQVARPRRPGAKHDGVELLEKLCARRIPADLLARQELNPFVGQQLHAALDDRFFELHIGDAVHQQAADAVGPLEDGDLVAGAIELGGRRQSRGPGADHGDRLSRARPGRFRRHPALLEAAVDDRAFDRLDRHRRLDDSEHARALARGGADAAGEFGEVVRLVQAIEGLAPAIAIDEVVPLGDQVVDGTAGRHVGHQVAGVAKRNAAIHAARTLFAQLAGAQVLVELVPIEHAQRGIAILRSCRENSVKPVGLPIRSVLVASVSRVDDFSGVRAARQVYRVADRRESSGPRGSKCVLQARPPPRRARSRRARRCWSAETALRLSAISCRARL